MAQPASFNCRSASDSLQKQRSKIVAFVYQIVANLHYITYHGAFTNEIYNSISWIFIFDQFTVPMMPSKSPRFQIRIGTHKGHAITKLICKLQSGPSDRSCYPNS